MNISTYHLTGDEFLVENFEELGNVRVRFDLCGPEAIALLTALKDAGETNPICKKIAQAINAKLTEKLAREICSLSR